MTTLDVARPITGGVDTHLDLHVAAALDPIGGPQTNSRWIAGKYKS